MHDYLPHVFMIRGRRLLYSHGIFALVGFTALLLIVFGGVTDRLIPLFAIGAFLAFTLSQAGMVMHWKRQGGKGSLQRMIINGVGAVATGVTLVVVLVAKFTEGAWITAILIPALIIMMSAVKRHYDRVSTADRCRLPHAHRQPHRAAGHRSARPLDPHHRKGPALRHEDQRRGSSVHVDAEECCDEVKQMWQQNVAAPLRESGKTVPELILLASPYRFVIMPLVEHILKVEHDHPESSDRRPGSRTGGQTLVADAAPQSAGSVAEATSAGARQSAHHGHQYSLVSVTPRDASGSNHLEADGIAKADRVVRGCGRKTEVAMKVELLMWRRLIGHAEIDYMLGAAVLGKRAGIFDIGVPGLSELPVKVQTGLARQVSPPRLGWPHRGRTFQRPSSSLSANATRAIEWPDHSHGLICGSNR